MSTINYIPLGSVVLLQGGTQKILIVARGINTRQNGETVFFDYGAVLYPDGLTSDRMAYFNHEAISRVLFYGYDDEENRNCCDNINRYLANNPGVKRGGAGT